MHERLPELVIGLQRAKGRSRRLKQLHTHSVELISDLDQLVCDCRCAIVELIYPTEYGVLEAALCFPEGKGVVIKVRLNLAYEAKAAGRRGPCRFGTFRSQDLP